MAGNYSQDEDELQKNFMCITKGVCCRIRGGRASPFLAAWCWGEKDKEVYSDGRTERRDYSRHCEKKKKLKIRPQGSE